MYISGLRSLGLILCLFNSQVSASTIAFNQVGQLHLTATMFHVKLDVDLRPFQQTCSTFKEMTHPAIPTSNMETFNQILWDQHLLCRELDDLNINLREKRGILSKVFASIAGIFGLTTLADIISGKQAQDLGHILHTVDNNQWRIGNIYKDLLNIQTNLQQLDNRTHKIFTEIEDVRYTSYLESVTTSFAHNFQQVLHAIPMLNLAKIPSSIIHSTDVARIMTNLKVEATNRHVYLPTTIISQFYLLPCSYIISGESIQIVIHVPTTNMPPLKIFQFIENIIPISQNDTIVFYQISNKNKFLALDNTENQFLTFESTKECIKILNSYFCKNKVLFYDIQQNCLVNLYKSNFNNIHQICNTYPIFTNFTISPHPHGWHIASKQSMEIHIQCNNGTNYHLEVRNIQLLNLPNICTAHSKFFILNGQTLDLNLIDRHNVLNSTQIQQWHIPHKILAKLDTKLSIWDTISMPQTPHAPLTYINSSIIVCNLVILGILIMSILYCMARKENNVN